MEHRIFELFLPHLNHWGYYALLLMTFLETSAFLGLLVPGESMVVIAGLLASRGVFELGDVIWVASLGAIAGDTVGYYVGCRYGETLFLKYGRFFYFKKEHLDQANRFFKKYGGKTVFLGRFMAWLRSFAPVVAGMAEMSYPRFLFFNVSGGIAWAIVFSLLGYFLGNSWDHIKVYLDRIGILAFIAGILGVSFYLYFTKRRRMIRNKVSWIRKGLSSRVPKAWHFVKSCFRAR